MKIPGLPLPPGYRVEANAQFAYLFYHGRIIQSHQDEDNRLFLLSFEHEYKPVEIDRMMGLEVEC